MAALRITFEVPDSTTAQQLLALAAGLPGVSPVSDAKTEEWDLLPPDLRAELEQALEEVERGEGIPWEEFERQLSERYPELK